MIWISLAMIDSTGFAVQRGAGPLPANHIERVNGVFNALSADATDVSGRYDAEDGD